MLGGDKGSPPPVILSGTGAYNPEYEHPPLEFAIGCDTQVEALIGDGGNTNSFENIFPCGGISNAFCRQLPYDMTDDLVTKNILAVQQIGPNNDRIYEWILKARNHGLKNRDECESSIIIYLAFNSFYHRFCDKFF